MPMLPSAEQSSLLLSWIFRSQPFSFIFVREGFPYMISIISVSFSVVSLRLDI